MTKRIARVAFAAAAVVALALPSAAQAHCTYLGTFVEVCSPL